MLIIGLTGGIASGKSLAAETLSSLNVPIIDADHIAKSLTEAHSPLAMEIIEHFGDKITNNGHNINRQALAHIIFNHTDERLWLNRLLHPPIRNNMLITIEQYKQSNKHPYCVCVIPLLTENWPISFIESVLLIDTTPELQLKRLCHRNGLTAEQAKQRLTTQATQQERYQIADTIIDNSSSKDKLRDALIAWHNQIIVNSPL